MIGITFALPTESSGFAARLQEKSRKAGVLSGILHGKEVAVAHTGVGEKIAMARIEGFLTTHSPRLLISAGFAGALTSELELGDLVAAENFSEQSLIDLCRAALPERSLRVLQAVTVQKVLDSEQDRKGLACQTGARMVDMETAAIAAVCAAHRIPLLSLRAISDTAAAPFPAPPSILFDLERQKTNYRALLFYLLRHPHLIPRFAGFTKQVALARRSLAAGLDLVVRRL